MGTLALNLSPSPVSGAPLVWIGGGQAGTGRPEENQQPSKAADLAELKATDRRVRAHESAHQVAGGGLVRGGASFTYRRGSDGQLYAVGGEVTLDTSPVPNNPRATQAKMRQVVTAALAPADPSPQDRAVAARAAAEAVIAASRMDLKPPDQGLDLQV
jgi:hypothetical protein